MKAVLVIDMPEEYMGSNIDVKLYGKYQTIHERYVNKLRPLPRKINIEAQEDIDYQRFYENPDAKRLADEIVESQGATRIGSTRDIYHSWNACLDAITGETE